MDSPRPTTKFWATPKITAASSQPILRFVLHQRHGQFYDTENNTVEMAPIKKNKKDSNTINSKLALVMKSGKGSLLPLTANIFVPKY